jgi:hypothetical protein
VHLVGFTIGILVVMFTVLPLILGKNVFVPYDSVEKARNLRNISISAKHAGDKTQHRSDANSSWDISWSEIN